MNNNSAFCAHRDNGETNEIVSENSSEIGITNTTTELIEFNELPNEIIYKILSNLPYADKCIIRQVCYAWNEFLKDMVRLTTWEDIGGQNDLDLVEMVDESLEDPKYNWFLIPKRYKNTKTNLIKLYSESILNYERSNDAQIVPLEEPNRDEKMKELYIERRKEKAEYAEKQVKNITGDLDYKVLKELSHRFMHERMRLFDIHYKLGIVINSTQIPLIVAKRFESKNNTTDNGSSDLFRVQFTVEGFTDNGLQGIHDFKLYKHKVNNSSTNKIMWKWEGLGDNWEKMTARQIFEKFNPRLNPNGKGVMFQLLSYNEGSRTISHLFEAIIYLSECIIEGNPVKWE